MSCLNVFFMLSVHGGEHVSLHCFGLLRLLVDIGLLGVGLLLLIPLCFVVLNKSRIADTNRSSGNRRYACSHEVLLCPVEEMLISELLVCGTHDDGRRKR